MPHNMLLTVDLILIVVVMTIADSVLRRGSRHYLLILEPSDLYNHQWSTVLSV